MTVTTVELDTDLRNRWKPSEAQLDRARQVFAYSVRSSESDDYVYVVPIVLRNKSRGLWTADVIVETIDHYGALAFVGQGSALWPSVSRNEALTLVEDHAALRAGPDDTTSYAYIYADGHWAVWESI